MTKLLQRFDSRSCTAAAAAGTVEFTYNADGQRIEKAGPGSATGFLYDHKHLLHETEDGIGGEVSKTYASTTDDEFGDLISETGSELYHQFDAQANTNALLDESGAVAARFRYDAFGNVLSASVEGDAWATLTVDPQWATMTVDQWAELPVELTTQLGMVGQKQYYRDAETELYLLGGGTNGRYYDPKLGRFVSEDPVRQAGGDPNLYPYVQANPVNRLDPSGHTSIDDPDRPAESFPTKQQDGAGQSPKDGQPQQPGTDQKPPTTQPDKKGQGPDKKQSGKKGSGATDTTGGKKPPTTPPTDPPAGTAKGSPPLRGVRYGHVWHKDEAYDEVLMTSYTVNGRQYYVVKRIYHDKDDQLAFGKYVVYEDRYKEYPDKRANDWYLTEVASRRVDAPKAPMRWTGGHGRQKEFEAAEAAALENIERVQKTERVAAVLGTTMELGLRIFAPGSGIFIDLPEAASGKSMVGQSRDLSAFERALAGAAAAATILLALKGMQKMAEGAGEGAEGLARGARSQQKGEKAAESASDAAGGATKAEKTAGEAGDVASGAQKAEAKVAGEARPCLKTVVAGTGGSSPAVASHES